jgi:hypothetical protein
MQSKSKTHPNGLETLRPVGRKSNGSDEAAGASGKLGYFLTINTTLVAVRMVFTFHDLPIGVKMF